MLESNQYFPWFKRKNKNVDRNIYSFLRLRSCVSRCVARKRKKDFFSLVFCFLKNKLMNVGSFIIWSCVWKKWTLISSIIMRACSIGCLMRNLSKGIKDQLILGVRFGGQHIYLLAELEAYPFSQIGIDQSILFTWWWNL